MLMCLSITKYTKLQYKCCLLKIILSLFSFEKSMNSICHIYTISFVESFLYCEMHRFVTIIYHYKKYSGEYNLGTSLSEFQTNPQWNPRVLTDSKK